MYQRMYVDEPNNWQEISLDEAKDKLSAYYTNVDEVLMILRQGSTLRTPWAFYRWVEVLPI